MHPHYRSERPLDATLLKVQPGLDDFITEKYADQIAAILGEWTASLLHSPRETVAIGKVLAGNFSGISLKPVESRVVRSNAGLEVRKNKFAAQPMLNRDEFLRDWQSSLGGLARIVTAEFQITRIDVAQVPGSGSAQPQTLRTHIRYEIVGGRYRIFTASSVSAVGS